MKRIARIIVNLLGYDAGWAACVIAAANGLWWLALPAVALLVALHAGLAPRPWREVLSVLAVAAIGACADSVLALLGLISLNGHPGLSLPFVLWIAALWANFAPLLTVILTWFRTRLVLAALLGAASAPLAYFGAFKLGAIEIIEPAWWLYGAVSVEYAILLPLMLVISTKIVEPRAQPLGVSGTGSTEQADRPAS